MIKENALEELKVVSIEKAEEIYNEVTEKYETGLYTQERIAKELNISLKAVAWCTQYYGYCHTKAINGKKPIIFSNDLKKLQELLE